MTKMPLLIACNVTVDIYNMDETDLLNRAQLNKTLVQEKFVRSNFKRTVSLLLML